jgi:hypothetical protein
MQSHLPAGSRPRHNGPYFWTLHAPAKHLPADPYHKEGLHDLPHA